MQAKAAPKAAPMASLLDLRNRLLNKSIVLLGLWMTPAVFIVEAIKLERHNPNALKLIYKGFLQ